MATLNINFHGTSLNACSMNVILPDREDVEEPFPGAHKWDYWDLHIQDAIAFHRESLQI